MHNLIITLSFKTRVKSSKVDFDKIGNFIEIVPVYLMKTFVYIP